MAFVFSGNPLTGTATQDYIIDYALNAPNNTLTGLAGNDLMLADFDFFYNSFQGHFGASAGAAYNITSNTSPWSTYENSEIVNSTTVPHTSILFSGASGGQAFWSVVAGAGSTITLDVDFGDPDGNGTTDTIIEIYAADGVTLLASNDDAGIGSGGDGSVSSYDSFLQHTFATTGTYIIKLKEFGSSDGNVFEADDDFVLNVSLTGQAVTNDSPVTGNDILDGGAGQDLQSGGGGNDTFYLRTGDVVANEYYIGGTGTDTLLALGSSGSYDHDFTTSAVASIEAVGLSDPGPGGSATFRFLASQIGPGIASNASVSFSGYSDVTDTFRITMDSTSSVNLSGLVFSFVDSVNDSVIINGDGDNETITGSTVRDIINGGGGNDTIDGWTGADTMVGGDGDDTYGVRDATDIVDETGSTGIDKVNATVTVNLSDAARFKGDIENVTLVGVASISATGNALANLLIGNANNNTLNGLGGADTMRGLGGNDLYGVENANDVVDESVGGSGGIDTVNATVSVNLTDAVRFKGNIENVSLFGAANISATGNAIGNVLIGNSGNNTLNGNGGADTMRGLAGNDIYGVHDITDIVDESVAGSAGIDTVNSMVNMSLVNVAGAAKALGNVENISLFGAGNIFAYGNALANTLIGNVGINTLAGGLGNDTLTGNGGNDIFVFNTAPNAATNMDNITDMNQAGNDTIHLENAVFAGLAAGALAAGAFVSNGTGLAGDADDRVIYNIATGQLFFDSNGNAAGGSVQFALLDAGLAMSAADFFVI